MQLTPRKAGIYKLTNKVNGKIYIGKTKNFHRRMSNHKVSKNRCPVTYAIKKYGFDNFDLEILAEFDHYDNIELLALEVAFIEYFDSTNPNIGYNICLFATDKNGIPMSEEQKKKLSQAMKGRFIGANNPFFGKHHCLHTRQLISRIHKGKTISAQERQDRSRRQTGKNNISFDPRQFIFYNKKTEETFTGTKMDFYTKFGLHRGNVSQLVLGTHRSVKGWSLVGPAEPHS